MMGYFDLINRFWIYYQKNRLGSNAIALYFYLLQKNTFSNCSAFNASDVAISKDLRLTRKTVKSVREKLTAQGLISVRSRKGIACEYKIIMNFPLENSVDDINVREIFRRAAYKSNDENKEIILSTESISADSPFNFNPTIHQFLEYAASLGSYQSDLKPKIQKKYESWQQMGWVNSSGRPITNWKASLKSALPYLKNGLESTAKNKPALLIPKIYPPKTSKNNE